MKFFATVILLLFINCNFDVSREQCYEFEGISDRGFNICAPLSILAAKNGFENRLRNDPSDSNQSINAQLDNWILSSCLDRQRKVDKCDKRPSFGK